MSYNIYLILGDILVDGNSIKSLNSPWLRSNMGLVNQVWE